MNRAHLLDVLMDHRKTCLSTAIEQNLVGKDCIFLHPPEKIPKSGIFQM